MIFDKVAKNISSFKKEGSSALFYTKWLPLIDNFLQEDPRSLTMLNYIQCCHDYTTGAVGLFSSFIF